MAEVGIPQADEITEEHAFDILEYHGSEIIIAATGVFMVAAVIGNLLHKYHVAWLPESLVVIALGAVFGLIFRHMYSHEFNLETDSVINEGFLQDFLLPIIIFEAGWSLRNKEFMAQLPYIMIFAVLGTVICMTVVALLLVATSQLHGITGYRLAFTYGALIAAVDPVATLATYAHLNVEPLLNILVMGESIINDAVAITLFEVLNSSAKLNDESVKYIMLAITADTIQLMVGSVLLGLALGFVLSLVVRITGMRSSPNLAILLVLVSAYFSYHVSTKLKMSGIITVLHQGMLMSGFVTHHLTIEGSMLTSFLLKQMASLADMTVFLFVGIAIAFSTPTGFLLGGLNMLFCLLGRALATFPLAGVCNVIKAQAGKGLEREKQLMITPRHMFMMWHAGLRGGIALVLCLSLGDWVDPKMKVKLIQATTCLICVFLLVFGGTTKLFLKWLNIPMGNPPPMYLHNSIMTRMLLSLTRNVLKPVLKGEKKDLMMEDSVVAHIMKEAKIKNDIDRSKQRKRYRDGKNRWGMFGNIDPVNVDSGWCEGDPEDDRWMNFYHDNASRCSRSSVCASSSSEEDVSIAAASASSDSS